MKANLPLYTAKQTRALDQAAIQAHAIPGYTLMTRAGQECFRVLRVHWREADRITVVCGGGNNGGDGFVLGRSALQAGLSVRLLLIGDFDRLAGDAKLAANDFVAAGGEVSPWRLDGLDQSSDKADSKAEVLVDAMLGTGLDRALGGDYLDAVQAINTHPAPVLAVDVPTGINADTGAMMGRAVRAKVTVSFIGRKRGLFTGPAMDHVGTLLFDDLQVPAAIYQEVTSSARLLMAESTARQLGPRPVDSHKGVFGSVLVVGGDHGMAGAVRMTGEAALRSGAGLVKVATRAANVSTIAADRPELMAAALDAAGDLSELLDWASVVAVGPGLGHQSDWSRQLLDAALASSCPLVVDADGLNLLARTASGTSRDNWILTPHPGEAAMLLDSDTATVQANRFDAAATIAEQYNAVCVLKGAGTIIANPGGVLRVVYGGNPGMASAGMGDVLTGVIASLLGQGLSADVAADAGVCVHAAAGDRAAESGQRGLIASDVIAALPAVLG